MAGTLAVQVQVKEAVQVVAARLAEAGEAELHAVAVAPLAPETFSVPGVTPLTGEAAVLVSVMVTVKMSPFCAKLGPAVRVLRPVAALAGTL